ncbi:hypothetical protein OW763_10950 [Clostridium aestuarii]|uniref:CARDB domain-containing protein n=1 Tax=Clostridium aestuarii TaxID=338193 RepID=A0ABT4D0U8_9CLOT|nr:CARDB domain-containing protein [Clostridium aestuarii]MCY6484859.1 hypothetical protein [Clostridium aestuarii]
MKKIMSFLMTFIMSFTMVATLGVESAVAETSEYKPKLIIENTEIPKAKTGETLNLELKFKNDGEYTAEDIEVIPQFDENSPFQLDNLTVSKTIDLLSPNKSKSVTYSLKVRDDVELKTYPIVIKYIFKNLRKEEFVENKTIYVKIVKGYTAASIVIENIKTNPEVIDAGSDFNFSFDLKNKGLYDAKNVKISLEGLNKDAFTLNKSTNLITMKELKGALTKKSLSFSIHSNKDMETGSYALKAKVEYEDGKGNNKTEEHEIFLKVNSSEDSNLIIENVVYPTQQMLPSKNFTVSFDLKNNGQGTAKNVTVTVDGGEKILPTSQSLQVINELKTNQVKKLTFTFQASEDAETKSYPISIEVKTDEKDAKPIKQYASVYIKQDSKKSTPKIIISGYESNPRIVSAGSNFDLSVAFLNTNQYKTVRNIKVNLTVEEVNDKNVDDVGSVFVPVESSNTFYINEIAPGKEVTKELTLYTIPNAKAKTYNVIANLEYEDNEGKELKATENIGIHVEQPAKLQVAEIKMPKEAFVGQPIDLAEPIQFYNTGKVIMSNFMVKAQGEFDVQNGNYFIGNFETGNSDEFYPEIIPSKTGEAKGKIIFSYDEPNGEHKEVIKEITINAQDMPEPEMGPDEMGEGMGPDGMPPAEGGNKMSTKKKVGIGVAVAAIIILGVVIKKRRAKKREEMTLDE